MKTTKSENRESNSTSHVISNFSTLGGNHCITTALRQILVFKGIQISEEMLFCLGEGLAFCYVNLEKSPMVSGRCKVFEFEEKLAEGLGITITCKSSAKYETAFVNTIKMLNNNEPVLVYVDMPYLSYLALDSDSHFGGHAVVIFGYDMEKRVFYVSDRDNSDNPIRTPSGDIAENYHLVSFDEMEKARSSNFRPFPAKNKYLHIQIPEQPDDTIYGQPAARVQAANAKLEQPGLTITSDMLISAVNATCRSMLNPPAQLFGINGIYKFSREVLKWAKYSDEKLATTGVTNYFMISHDGGTGGGIFRKLFGNFLIEAASILENTHVSKTDTCGKSAQLLETVSETDLESKLESEQNMQKSNLANSNWLKIGNEFVKLSYEWDNVASFMWKLYETKDRNLLPEISDTIKKLADKEKELLTTLSEI